MGDQPAESEARARSSGLDSPYFISDEEFRKTMDALKKKHDALPVEIVPCKSRSRMYASTKFQRLEKEHGYPAGRMFAPGIIQFGQSFWGGSVCQVRDGWILGRAGKSVIIKSVDLAQEKGLEDLPHLLREARAYEDLKKLAGKCLPKFCGSGILGNEYALVVEKVPGKMLHTLSSAEKAECRGRVLEAYKALHDAGYVQGDVRGSNMLVDGKVVTIIDLDMAEKVPRSSKRIEEEDRVVLELFS